MTNYDNQQVKVMHIHKSTKNDENSFVEYVDLGTGKQAMLMMKNFIRRYGR